MQQEILIRDIQVTGSARQGQPESPGELLAGAPMDALSPDLAAKAARLRQILAGLGSVVVAFSGGVDSSLVLKASLDELGPERVLAVLAVSESLAERDRADAVSLIGALGAPYRLITTKELSDPRYAGNPSDRCYFCKEELHTALTEVARKVGFAHVVDGTNLDDLGDYRPGLEATQRLGVRSPLREAGLRKADIRALSRHLGLPTWDKPAAACLASRIPYNVLVTAESLRQVDRAEQRLVDLGFRQVRVRHHGAVARIEVPPDDILRLAQPGVREAAVQALKDLGYRYVTLDLTGYRTGSLNEELARQQGSGNGGVSG